MSSWPLTNECADTLWYPVCWLIDSCKVLTLHIVCQVFKITKTSFFQFYLFVFQPAWRCLWRSTMQQYRLSVNLTNANIAAGCSYYIHIYIYFINIFFVDNIHFLFMFCSKGNISIGYLNDARQAMFNFLRSLLHGNGEMFMAVFYLYVFFWFGCRASLYLIWDFKQTSEKFEYIFFFQ